jgi:hypothetical protein
MIYDLYGVVNHLGGMFGGHYIACAQVEDIYRPTQLSPPPPNNNNNNQDALLNSLLSSNHIPFQDYLTTLDAHTNNNNNTNNNTNNSNNNNNNNNSNSHWYKFDDEFVTELTSLLGDNQMNIQALESYLNSGLYIYLFIFYINIYYSIFLNYIIIIVIIVIIIIIIDGAYLLFYKKRKLSADNLWRYL